ncbi:MAG: glycosyltransferase family 2 protein [Chloroflexi bacterium]|nr:glycosyltransferase family 2 protein [Chloroflexota bacterium]
MFDNAKIAVIVTAYNEEKLIGGVLETMPDYADRIYVVDDASTDATAQIVAERARRDPRITLISHTANQGPGGTVVTGYRQALADGMDVVAVMAGDAQTDPADLPAMIGPIVRGEADYVKGNRLYTGEAWHIIPRYRYLGNAFLSLFTKIASGYWHIADSQTGYTAISRDALSRLPLDRFYRRYGYPNHMLVLLNVNNFRVRDVPIRPIYNVGEKSGIRLPRVIPTLSWLLFKCFWWRLREKYVIRDFHPLVFFYLVGMGLFFPGVAFGLYLVWFRLIVGPIKETGPLFAVVLVITGLQFLLFAMWFDMDYNKHLR